MVTLPGAVFLMGSEDAAGFAADAEGPVREVTLSSFRISACAVTNAEFATFVKATTYSTDAERFGWSFVFEGFLPSHLRRGARVSAAPWWVRVEGASWRHPEGPGSSVGSRQSHPVVHVSWHDAQAYCAWRGVRLPTEAEWEYAARGELVQRRYPWGDELTAGGVHRCNIWQGTFPTHNTAADGHLGTAPVTAYRPNGFGLHNVSGNVWEWCGDWWSTDWHMPEDAITRVDPRGPATGSEKVVKGGSYLCHQSYCNRYRVGARTKNTPDSSTGHMGFRVAANV